MRKQETFLGIPYDWRPFSLERFKSSIWNKKDHRVLVPRSFGWGYTINFYELLHHRKGMFIGIVTIVVLLFYFLHDQSQALKKAHSTFENYYVFRGCTKLLKRTPTYGICQISQGQTIKIVEFHNKWYLDGDLPICLFNICK